MQLQLDNVQLLLQMWYVIACTALLYKFQCSSIIIEYSQNYKDILVLRIETNYKNS